MKYTSITQKRYSVSPTPDTIKFRIETTVLEMGELPRVDIFVYDVVDSVDPSMDVFSHVASLAELQSLENERDKAIVKGDSSYMSPYIEMEYTDLETAVAAAPTLNARINDLILAWITYSSDFDSGGDLTYNLPTVSDSELDARKNAYVEAKKETTTASADVVTAGSALDSAETTLAHNQEILSIYNSQKSFCDTVVNNQYPTYVDLVISGNGESTAAFNYRTGSGSLEDSMAAFCASLSASIATWTNVVSASQDAVNTSRGEKISAEIELDKAEDREAEALAHVLEVCPDFDPNAV